MLQPVNDKFNALQRKKWTSRSTAPQLRWLPGNAQLISAVSQK
jgi:hypothetical protein